MFRSYLYVPANTPRFLAKAATRGADAIIIDLEDSVPEAGKTDAREAMSQWVPLLRATGVAVFVRVNRGARLVQDAVAADRAGADGIFIPKVNAASCPEDLDRQLGPASARQTPMGFVPMIEDPAGLLAAPTIAQAPRVVALTVGEEDLATAMDAKPLPHILRLPKLMVHYAAKAAGKLSLGLFHGIADYADIAGVKAAAIEARAFGFDGAACIHPTIVPILNEAFSPTQAELDRARRIILSAQARQASGCGAFMLDGCFIDAPIIIRAERLLQRHGQGWQHDQGIIPATAGSGG
ncbi:CoA ester lyase [Niveispirillum sp.]|uniref:HpcH/HpaI aldolase/citrate lyase family protein n=1 Tax=Niveispirillum sp. TaxID=1917217 RepID=UPI001B42EFD3|nr:CoA ester lyase [Niveispirillum sp.]MBP7337421.1 CoA ester lyase [Niveispirillum sp.]